MGTGIITRDFFLKFYLFIAKGASYHGVTSLNVGLETKLSQVNEHIAPSVRTCRGSIYAPEAHLSNPALRDVINAAPTRTQNGISYTI